MNKTIIDFKQIPETNFEILKAILKDDNTTIDGYASTIKDTWDDNMISELVYFLMNNNKKLCEIIEGWDIKAIGNY
jgi:hypothetical protein